MAQLTVPTHICRNLTRLMAPQLNSMLKPLRTSLPPKLAQASSEASGGTTNQSHPRIGIRGDVELSVPVTTILCDVRPVRVVDAS